MTRLNRKEKTIFGWRTLFKINTTLLSEIKFELQSLSKWLRRPYYYYYCYQKGPVPQRTTIHRMSVDPSYWRPSWRQNPWLPSWCSSASWSAVVHPRRRVPYGLCIGRTAPPFAFALDVQLLIRDCCLLCDLSYWDVIVRGRRGMGWHWGLRIGPGQMMGWVSEWRRMDICYDEYFRYKWCV